MTQTDVAIIGAGPYGLSIAAHLAGAGRDFRIFGSPMHTWRTHMPKGMFLKSEGFACSLFDPEDRLDIATYCRENGLPYQAIGLPIPLETFAAYGLAFQQRFVPHLETCLVHSVRRTGTGFEIRLDMGETFTARKVIVAVGINSFAYLPPMLSELEGALASHSSHHHGMEPLAGKDVVVVGGGSSATDVAAQLSRVGARVEIVSRGGALRFHNPPERKRRPLLRRLRSPRSELGLGWKSRLCSDMPMAFYRLPERMRLDIIRRHLGPAACWFTREQIEGKVAVHAGSSVEGARVNAGRVELQVRQTDGATRQISADHVVGATGFRISMDRLGFLDKEVRSAIRVSAGAPVLSNQFESSVPGLHFAGTTAANSFGPLLRFTCGAQFAARRLTSVTNPAR